MCSKKHVTLSNTGAKESQIYRLSMTSHIDYAQRHVVASSCGKPQVTTRIERKAITKRLSSHNDDAQYRFISDSATRNEHRRCRDTQ